jgi:hypothetical protein
MIRKPRDYTHHLRAFWRRRFPDRPAPEFKEFADELICVLDLLMFQIDPTGKDPILHPAAYAEGVEPTATARPSAKRGRAKE